MMGLKDIPEIYEDENFQNFISLQNGTEFMDNLNEDVKELEKYDLVQTYSEKFSYYKSEITDLVSTKIFQVSKYFFNGQGATYDDAEIQ